MGGRGDGVVGWNASGTVNVVGGSLRAGGPGPGHGHGHADKADHLQ